jgi:hypothetical protein
MPRFYQRTLQGKLYDPHDTHPAFLVPLPLEPTLAPAGPAAALEAKRAIEFSIWRTSHNLPACSAGKHNAFPDERRLNIVAGQTGPLPPHVKFSASGGVSHSVQPSGPSLYVFRRRITFDIAMNSGEGKEGRRRGRCLVGTRRRPQPARAVRGRDAAQASNARRLNAWGRRNPLGRARD